MLGAVGQGLSGLIPRWVWSVTSLSVQEPLIALSTISMGLELI